VLVDGGQLVVTEAQVVEGGDRVLQLGDARRAEQR
jgi:hypothetical protein